MIHFLEVKSVRLSSAQIPKKHATPPTINVVKPFGPPLQFHFQYSQNLRSRRLAVRSLADAAKYLGVAQKTLAVYHRAALDILIKAANSPESLGSLREYVLVGVESPSKDVHASPASIHSSLVFLSGVSVDLLEEENSAESLKKDNTEWDDDKRPLTQPSLKRSLHDAREIHRTATWEAPPAPEGATINRDFSNVPQPLERMRRPRYPPRHVPRENTCSKCCARFLFGDPCVVVPAFSAKCAMHLTMSLAFMPPRLLLP